MADNVSGWRVTMTPQSPGARPPRMQDVADQAGVSLQTVSRVVNADPGVMRQTRNRVQAAIEELGYRRNSAARSLVTRRSNTIGVVISSGLLFSTNRSLLGIESAAREAGYFVNVASLSDPDPAGLPAVLRHFSDMAVEGVIVIAPEVVLAYKNEPVRVDVPMVLVAAASRPAPGVYVAAVDQRLGARLAVRHLIELGHTDIAHAAGTARWSDSIERTVGWRAELKQAGLPAGTLLEGDWTAASGYRIANVLAETGLPQAVFAANDMMALGMIRAFHQRGISVPGDISIVGFDDMPGADHFLPALTTVQQDFDTLGRHSFAVLLGALNLSDLPAEVLTPKLIIRESTAPAADFRLEKATRP